MDKIPCIIPIIMGIFLLTNSLFQNSVEAIAGAGVTGMGLIGAGIILLNRDRIFDMIERIIHNG